MVINSRNDELKTKEDKTQNSNIDNNKSVNKRLDEKYKNIGFLKFRRINIPLSLKIQIMEFDHLI